MKFSIRNGIPVIVSSPRDNTPEGYKMYVENGGSLSLDQWNAANQPTDPRTPAPGTTAIIDGQPVYTPLQSGSSASQMLADVTRATYDDWRKQYLPIALEMMNQTTYNNPDLVNKEVKSAVGNVESAFKNTQSLQDRTASRYGISFDDRQRAASDRITGLEKSTAVVDAANRIRQKLADRNKQIAAGGIPAINATQGG